MHFPFVHKLLLLLVVCVVAYGADARAANTMHDYSYYTSNGVGDTVVVYGRTTTVEAHLFIFADESSCYTCMLSLHAIADGVKAKNKTSTVLFLRGASQQFIDKLAHEYGWNFTVVDDPIGAYAEKFRVRNTPFYLLVDARGRIWDMGVISSVQFDFDVMMETVDGILLQAKEARENTSLPELRRRKLMDRSKQFITAGKVRFCSYLPESKGYCFLIPNAHAYVVTDSNGIVQRSVNMSTLKYIDVLTPLPINATARPSTILCADSEMETAERILYYWNYNTDSVTRLSTLQNTDAYNVGFEIIYTPARRIILGLHPTSFENTREVKGVNSLMMLDSLARPVAKFGRIPPHYYQYSLEGFYWMALAVDSKGCIYQFHNLSDRLYVYTPEGELRDSIPCSFDPATWYNDWREKAFALSDTSALEERKAFGDIISKVHWLYIDESTQDIYISYTNRKQRHEQQPAGQLYYFLHRIAADGKNADTDIPLPENTVPFRIDNGVVYTTQLAEDNSLSIVEYALP